MPQDLQFGVRPHHSGLLNAVALWAGFEQLPETCEASRSPRFLVALRSNLPVPLPAASIQVQRLSRDQRRMSHVLPVQGLVALLGSSVCAPQSQPCYVEPWVLQA